MQVAAKVAVVLGVEDGLAHGTLYRGSDAASPFVPRGRHEGFCPPIELRRTVLTDLHEVAALKWLLPSRIMTSNELPLSYRLKALTSPQ